MSEGTEILIKMSGQIGELCGTVKALAKSQEQTNHAVEGILKDHALRIESVEKKIAKTAGWASGAGLVAGGVGSFFLRLFS